MILNIDEYNKKYNDNLSLEPVDDDENLIQEGFIKWDDEDAYIWCGPFDGNFAKFSIIDYSKVKNLHNLEKTKELIIKNANFSIYNLPYRFKKEFKKYQMTPAEKTRCLIEMTKEELELYMLGVENEIESEIDSIRINPTKEYPVCIYIRGNDDFSKSLCVENEEIALKIFKEIEDNPIEDTLNKYDFKFSN